MRGADEGEVLDLVQRKGPISLRGIMEQQSIYAEDDVFLALKDLEEEGKVKRINGELDEHGTTADVWRAGK